MSESDSDTEPDQIHRTKRSVVVKINFDGSDLVSDRDVPSICANRLKGGDKKLSSTSIDSSSSDSEDEGANIGTKFGPKTYNFDDSDDSTSDDEWHPGTSAQPSTSRMALAMVSSSSAAAPTAPTYRGIATAATTIPVEDPTTTDSEGRDESIEVCERSSYCVGRFCFLRDSNLFFSFVFLFSFTEMSNMLALISKSRNRHAKHM